MLLCYCERQMVDHLTDGRTTAISINKLYGGVILINCVGSFFLMFFLGVRAGRARARFRAKAEKSGDDFSAVRFASARRRALPPFRARAGRPPPRYPKLYAEGFSEEATHFNCVGAAGVARPRPRRARDARRRSSARTRTPWRRTRLSSC